MKKEPAINPYEKTAVGRRDDKDSRLMKVIPEELNVLSLNTATEMSAGLTPYNANFMSLWAEGRGTQSLEWQLKVPEAGNYEITALVQSEDCTLKVKIGSQSSSRQVQEKQWNRVGLGSVTLVAGANQLRVDIDSKAPVKVSALEIVRPTVKEDLLADALSFRNSPVWFKDAGYGLMFQWTNRATPPTGPIIEWDKKVADFNLDTLVNLVEETGASFVVWSVTWGQQYISAPINALDNIMFGRTTKRDMLGELAERLHQKGIRLIFYYHYGYDCYHSKDPEWMRAAGGYLSDKTILFENIMKIVSEVGQRYGKTLDGWFFDGGQRYYDTHFDSSSIAGISSAPFKQIGIAARSGNAERVICYNSWILPRLTEYQDYFAGEGKVKYDELDEGIFEDGGHKGLMGFGCFTLERRWGHIDENEPIAAPGLTSEQLIEIIKQGRSNRYPIAINLEMYEDGSVSPQSADLLRTVVRRL